MIRIIRNVFYLLLASVMVALIIFLPLTIYGIRQLTGQLRISGNAVSISEYVTEHSADTVYTPKLKYLEVVRAFAMDSLELHSSDNYTTFYDHGSKPLMWVVTACKPYSLEPASWWFPFLGSVTYKGFFDESLASEEARGWQQKGYETDIYNPSAWSTLGFLHDPVLSGMLQRGPGSLAELIIHELTHATIFLAGDIDYNENIATFIGEQGAIEFLEMHFGKSSPEVERYTNRLKDQDVYARHMLHGAQRLDSLYRTFSNNMPESEKAEKKFRLISEIMLGINLLPLKEPARYRFDFRNSELPKNPDFMAYIRYRKDQSDLRERWSTEFQGDLSRMIRTLESEGGVK